MKKIIALLCFLSLGASAQTPELIPYLKNNHWGFVNQERSIVIPCMYQYVAPFSEGLAVVEINRKYGYIDKTGKVVIPVKYDKAQSFRQGRAKVETIFGKKTDGQFKAGYIDKTGKLVIPMSYLGLSSFRDSIAKFWTGAHQGYMNWQGDTLVPPRYAYSTRFREGRALASATPPRYEPALGRMVFSTAHYIDIKGKTQLTIRNAAAENYANGLALVIAQADDTTQATYFVNKRGKKVLDVSQYAAVSGFSEGLAAVVDQGKIGFINTQGKLVIPCQYALSPNWRKQNHKRRMPRFVEGVAAVRVPNKGWNLINQKGKLLLSAYYQYLQVVSKDQILASKNGRWGIIRASGQVVLPFRYHALKPFKNGLALVRQGKRFFYVDTAGEEYFE